MNLNTSDIEASSDALLYDTDVSSWLCSDPAHLHTPPNFSLKHIKKGTL